MPWRMLISPWMVCGFSHLAWSLMTSSPGWVKSVTESSLEPSGKLTWWRNGAVALKESLLHVVKVDTWNQFGRKWGGTPVSLCLRMHYIRGVNKISTGVKPKPDAFRKNNTLTLVTRGVTIRTWSNHLNIRGWKYFSIPAPKKASSLVLPQSEMDF